MRTTTPAGPTSTSYEVASVDTALRLLIALGERDEVRLLEAGEMLGVSRSTAHRLMQMLVKYGFAVQNPKNRAYAAGPTWSVFSGRTIDQQLALAAHPVLMRLAEETGETAQLLSLRSNANVICVTAAEGKRVVRAGANVGAELPAWLTAGGRILLALASPHLQEQASLRIGAGPAVESRSEIWDEIKRAGIQKKAVQRDIYEVGTSAVSVAVRLSEHRWLSVDVVLPTPRLTAESEEQILNKAMAAASTIEAAIEKLHIARV